MTYSAWLLAACTALVLGCGGETTLSRSDGGAGLSTAVGANASAGRASGSGGTNSGGTNSGSGGTGGSSSSATHDCNGTACTATQACVAYRTIGGVFSAPDGGACPTGSHVESNQCQPDFAYKCADLNGACQNQALTCACAQPPTNSPGVCPLGFGSCSQPGASADSSAQLICQKLVP